MKHILFISLFVSAFACNAGGIESNHYIGRGSEHILSQKERTRLESTRREYGVAGATAVVINASDLNLTTIPVTLPSGRRIVFTGKGTPMPDHSGIPMMTWRGTAPGNTGAKDISLFLSSTADAVYGAIRDVDGNLYEISNLGDKHHVIVQRNISMSYPLSSHHTPDVAPTSRIIIEKQETK